MVKDIGKLVEKLDKRLLRQETKLQVGDAVKMKVRVQEGEKTRLHPFEGTVIRMSGSGLQETFTVRKISYGEGVERTFPIHSPVIESLEIANHGITHRAKLYYLRDRIGKATRVKRDQNAPVKD